MAPKNRSKRRLYLILRILVATLVLILLVRIVEWPKLWNLFTTVRPRFVVLALLMMFAGIVLKTYRWHVLLQTSRPDVPLRMLLKCNLISYFVGIVAPTNLTGDVVRVYYLTRGYTDTGRAVSSILVDRMVGGLSLGLAAGLACLWIGYTGLFSVGTSATLGIAAFLLLSILIPISLLSRSMIAIFRRLLDRLPDRTWPKRLKKMFESLVAYRDHGSILTTSLLVSFVLIFLGLCEFYFIAEGFSSSAPFSYFVLFMPVTFFLAMVPVSLGGFGLMETAMVLFFTRVGLSLEICIAIVLVHHSLFLLTILPGGYFYVVEGFPSKRIPPQPAGFKQ